MRKRDLFRVFLRGFWLQASWSFEGMQSLGFAYAMEPALRRLYHDPGERNRALLRHSEFFNTHPFLALAILGCAVRLEEDGGADTAAQVARIKSALMGPYGALGDSFYWGGLKPLLVIVALHAAFAGFLWAPWVFLGCFAAAGAAGRAYGFVQGYRHGIEVVQVVSRLNLLRWAARCKLACALLLGTLVARMEGPTLIRTWEMPGWLWLPLAGIGVLVLSRVIQAGIRPDWLLYGCLLACVLLVVLT